MTAQLSDRLIYQGKTERVCSTPLASYFLMGGYRPDFLLESTANWRAYIATWEIIEDRLYLVGIEAKLSGDIEASVSSVFPEYPNRVFAHWYTGTLRVPRGELIKYVHGGFYSVYEQDFLIDVERGVVGKSWTRYNTLEREVKPEIEGAI